MTGDLPRPIGDSPHAVGNRAARVLWAVCYTFLFRFSPRNLHRWRNWLLRLFGARLSRTARVYPRARLWAPWNLTMEDYACIGDDVDVYDVAPVTIGAYSTVSQYSYLCTAGHDHNLAEFPLITRPITIGRRCWVAADVFVGPGVTIGDGTVVGARSSVFGDLPEWVIAVGTPARPTGRREMGTMEHEPAAAETR